ncbi:MULTISPECIES: TetR/AcrR family transcriptional regulator [unclassified Beijerinckia]|uniref:TetR/AcrR family transcriptional regulator n=1 Tax=unclassified Beijerinckia TaxID=2638183 RepID=UPI00089C0DBF|nr:MULTISPECIES: TetR/AcrR family transcriptional regulator [unclassified Beijerinckia]MDH7796332.1 AcrR family transcriptional regulator [Beijerinckia sp. GAS462]SEC40467.1 transcriptional regulator, TetR family [Beijerinckia sp. 28-YEA-48]
MTAASLPIPLRKGAATRNRILAEALRLFADKGVEGTSIRDIALAVGIVDAALYRHFRSKDEIASEVFLLHYGALAEAIAEIGEHKQSFRQTVRQLVDHFCTLFDEQPAVFAFILLQQHDHLAGIGDEANVVETLRQIMQRAHKSGDIIVGDANVAAAMALGTVIQPAVFKLYGRLDKPMKSYGGQLTEAVCRALGVP